jgi:hypothetical protein
MLLAPGADAAPLAEPDPGRARACVEAFPSRSPGVAAVCEILATPGRSGEGARLLDALVAAQPQDPAMLAGRARIARWSGDLPAARDLLVRAIAAAPDDGRLLAELREVEGDARRIERGPTRASLALAAAVAALAIALGTLSGRRGSRPYLVLVAGTAVLVGLALAWIRAAPGP